VISYPAPLLATGGSRTGVAQVNLLDIQDTNGNLYFFSDRPSNAPVAITGAEPAFAYPPVTPTEGQIVAWAYPSTVVATGGASAGNTSQMSVNGTVNALLSKQSDTEVDTYDQEIIWSGFTLPSLPAGTVIAKMFYVAIFSAGGTGGSFRAPVNPPSPATVVGWNGEASAVGTPNQSIAAVAAGLESYTMSAELQRSVWGDETLTRMAISFVGIAIYYASASGGEAGWGFPGEAAYGAGPYIPWLMSVPQFSFHRSLQTDIGAFVLQNLSGDTLSRDFEKIARRSALEGAFFIYRLWQADAQAAWLEVHGTLSVDDIGVDTVTLKGSQLLNPSQDDTPLEIYSETCQLQWGGPRCGATGDVECGYSYQSCQSLSRIMCVMNNYETNFGETVANTALNVTNRRRTI
jgi:hypothetical protein